MINRKTFCKSGPWFSDHDSRPACFTAHTCARPQITVCIYRAATSLPRPGNDLAPPKFADVWRGWRRIKRRPAVTRPRAVPGRCRTTWRATGLNIWWRFFVIRPHATLCDLHAAGPHDASAVANQGIHFTAAPWLLQRSTYIKKVAHTRLPSVEFPSWSQFLAVSLQVMWVIKPAVGCHYFPPSLQLPAQPLTGLLPILLLGEQRHNGCEQFA